MNNLLLALDTMNYLLNDPDIDRLSVIRSQKHIQPLHDFIKQELIDIGVKPELIFPHLNMSKPELKLAGHFKQKDQDVCVIPNNIQKISTPITWGPLASENKIDEYGATFTEKTLTINVRGQFSSLAKNTDTLFERTYAEALNLHLQYPNMVLGELYIIPTHADRKQTNLEKYISFFSFINNRKNTSDDEHKYEKVALVIVDFKHKIFYKNTQMLKAAGLVSPNFNLELSDLSPHTFAQDLVNIYEQRFGTGLIR